MSEPKPGGLSLAKVLEILEAFNKSKVITEKEAISRISHPLDFEADSGTLATLRERGATPDIIAAVEKYAKKEEPKGAIALTCYPPECKIAINGQPADTTSEGHFKRVGLKAGESYVVNCSRDGYYTKQSDIIAAVDPVAKSISLEPTDPMKLQLGKELYGLTILALGNNLNTLKSLTASGSATTYKQGKPVEWKFQVASAPRLIDMRVTNSMGALNYGCNEHICGEHKKSALFGKGGTKLSPETATELGGQLGEFSKFNLVTILETFGAVGVTLKAVTADKSTKSEQRLEASSRDATYVLVLGPDLLPTSAEYRPRAGLGAATITYGSYAKLGEAMYPKHTIIALKGSTESGIDVQLDQVSLGSKLSAADVGK